jgi:hypothetical protein
MNIMAGADPAIMVLADVFGLSPLCYLAAAAMRGHSSIWMRANSL